MAKGRMINRKIATDKNFNSLTVREQFLFMSMLPFIDDEGRMSGSLFEIKYSVIPSIQWTEEEIRPMIENMVKANLIYFEEDRAIQFRGFFKNQKIGHKPAKSLYPEISADTGIDKLRSSKVDKGANNIIEPNISKSNKKKIKYINRPKDLEMVTDYFKEKKIVTAKANAKKFFNYYETNGWVQGASKKPIKNWKACVRTWDFEKDDKEVTLVEKICPVYHHEDGHDRIKIESNVVAHCKKCRSMLVTLAEWQMIQVQDGMSSTYKLKELK